MYPFDLSKPLPLIRDHRGRQVIPQDFFINNDLEYLKGGDLSRRYSTSVTKTKAATYEIKWIEYLVRNLWSPVKDVYSRKRIIAVTRLTIMKKYDYGHLEEIEVCREDQKLYKFREGDFPRLRLQDIEDMLLLLIQQKLTNLTINEQSNLRNRTKYTAYLDPKGVIYKDQNNRNRLMRADELHKFSDGTLDDVRYGYIKNHKKTVKKRASADTRTEECTKARSNDQALIKLQSSKAKEIQIFSKSWGFIKLREKLGNSKAPKDYGRDKSVKSKPSLTQDQAHATSIMEKAQIHMGFCAKTLTKEAQWHPKGNGTLAIFRCPHNDQTTTIEAPMIRRFD
ncbi:hypothetical protein Tco_0620361 [Tanacetum coccineum]